MGVMLDTSVLFAFLNGRERRHREAQALMATLLEGDHGRLVTTSFTLDELASLGTGKRFPGRWAERLDALIGPHSDAEQAIIELIHPSRYSVERAHRLYVDRYDQGLSLTDWIQVVTMEEEGLDRIASFDQGFQGLVDMVPEDARGQG